MGESAMTRQALERITENDVKTAVMDYLATVPYSRWWRRNVIAVKAEYQGKKRFIRAGERGQSDVWGIWRGIHTEIELKRPGNTPNDEQKEYLATVRALGGIAFWADSVDKVIELMADEKRLRGWR